MQRSAIFSKDTTMISPLIYGGSKKSHTLRGCSYENSFLVVFPLNREKDIISLRSYVEIFPCLGEIYFGGEILREANIQNG